MREKLLVVVILFFSFNLQIFAFEARISLNRNDINISDYFTLQIEVQMDDWKNLEIAEIKWLEQFELVSRTQSQSSSTSISVVNWKAETVSRFVSIISLVLQPKSEWEFILWPVIIAWEDETQETNSLIISVSWENNWIQNSAGEDQNIVIWSSETENMKELPNKYTIYFLTIWLLIILFCADLLFKG
jgi:hypothetical protein